MATVEDTQAFLLGLPKKLRKPIAAALKEQAERLADAQRGVASAHSKSGELVGSIRVEPGRDELEVFVRAGGAATTKEVRDGSGVPYDYALADEFGTTHQAATPFFYPVYRELHDSIVEEISDVVQRAVNES